MTPTNFPKNIYFDTNILRKIGFTNPVGPFLELKEWSEKIKAPLTIPEVVWMEWIYDFNENIKKKSSQVKENLRDIEILIEQKQKKFVLPDDYAEKLILSTKRKLKNWKVNVVNTPKNISLEELVTMAAFKIKPFEEKKEKGFRDTIILYTVLEDMKVKKIKDSLFISDDSIFTHEDVNKIISKYSVNLTIKNSLEDSVAYLKGVMDDVVKKFMEAKKQKLLGFVKTKQDEIFKFVKDKSELTEDFITKGGFLSSKQEVFGQIEKVLEFEPVEIESAFEAATSPSEKQPPKNSEYILISVNTHLKIEYLPYLWFNRPSVKIEDISRFKEAIRSSSPQYYGDPTIKELTRSPSVTALVTKNEKGEYTSLKLERVNILF